MQDYKEMLEFFLPQGLLNYFKIINVRRLENSIIVRLEENEDVPEIPKEHRGKKVLIQRLQGFFGGGLSSKGKQGNIRATKKGLED